LAIEEPRPGESVVQDVETPNRLRTNSEHPLAYFVSVAILTDLNGVKAVLASAGFKCGPSLALLLTDSREPGCDP
jgi:hypothetical protein